MCRWQVLEIAWNVLVCLAWLTSVWEQCLEQFLGTICEHHFRTALGIVLQSGQLTMILGAWRLQNSPSNSSEKYEGFGATKSTFLQAVQLVKKSNWFDIYFFFIRFLLICQLEGANLTLTLNGFPEHCLRPVSRTGFTVFSSRNYNTNFTGFSLKFGLMFLRFLR